MPQVRNILVPIDTHENAGLVVQWAALFAHATGSRLTLLHVNESLEFMKARPGLHGGGFPGFDMTLDKWRQHYQQETKMTMDQLAHQYCSGVSVSFLMLEGRAHPTILGALETTTSDLVVMGTHGRRGLTRILMGSVAELVVRWAKCPVITVKSPPKK